MGLLPAQPTFAAPPLETARLRGLLEIPRLVRGGVGLPELLQAIVRGTADSAGYGAVVAAVRRPAWDDFEIAAACGCDEAEALLGQTVRWEFGEPLTAATSAALVVPMLGSSDEVLGVLSVDARLSEAPPSDDELDLLLAVAAYAAHAIEAAREAAEAARHREALEQLLRVSAQVAGTQGVDEVLHSVCEGISSALGFGLVVVELADREADRYVPRAAAGRDLSHGGIQLDVGVDSLAPLFDPQFEREGCYLLTRAEALERVGVEPTSFESTLNGCGPEAWDRHWLVVPLHDREGVRTGFIWVDDPADRLIPSRATLQALRTFAHHAETALDSAVQFAALRAASDRHRTLVEASPIGFVAIGRDRRVRGLNPAAERMFGYSEDEVVGNEPPWIADEEREEYRRRFDELLLGCGPTEAVYADRRADGTTIDVHTTSAVLRGPDGEVTGVLAAIADITAERRAQEALRLSEERQRALISSSPIGIVTLGVDGSVESWNPAAERMLGWSAGEVIGRPAPWVPAERHSEHSALLQRVVSGESIDAIELERVRRDGSAIVISISAAPLHDETGAVVGVISTVSDVTERIRSEEERARLEEELRHAQKMEAVGRLAGGIAHDFNNLLTAIGGYGELALARLPEDSPARSNVEEMRRAGERAATLTRQLLAFSRRQVLQPKVIDLNAVVSDVRALLERILGEDVELRTRLDADLGSTRADPGQIEQVIMNLAVNARDAMPRGGSLTIETANVEVDAELAARHLGAEPGPYVVVSVADTGCGMDRETLERAFEPFFTTKPVGQGTGLGLATVYGIVQQTGGHIWAYSEPGRGSTFKLYLPRVWDAASADEQPARPARVGGSETVLLVEDEEIVRSLVREMLEAGGYCVLEAPHGAAAIALAEAHGDAIDVLLTDVVMPGVSGQELAAQLGAIRPGLRVVFTSGYTEDAIANHGVLSPGTAFLEKPFTAAQLAQKLRDVLDG